MIEATRAVRMAGLKLLLCALSFGALAAVVHPGDVPLAEVSWGGMKVLHVILGTFAAGVSLFFAPQFTGKTLGATISCGLLFSAVGPPSITWFVQLWTGGQTFVPVPVENLLAIALGVLGVYIVPALQRLGEAIKANPTGFWKGPPPDAQDKGGPR